MKASVSYGGGVFTISLHFATVQIIKERICYIITCAKRNAKLNIVTVQLFFGSFGLSVLTIIFSDTYSKLNPSKYEGVPLFAH